MTSVRIAQDERVDVFERPARLSPGIQSHRNTEPAWALEVGATLIDVVTDYAQSLAEASGRIYLAGVSNAVAGQLRSSGKLDIGGGVQIVPARAVLGDSVSEALAPAEDWLRCSKHRPEQS